MKELYMPNWNVGLYHTGNFSTLALHHAWDVIGNRLNREIDSLIEKKCRLQEQLYDQRSQRAEVIKIRLKQAMLEHMIDQGDIMFTWLQEKKQ